MNRRRTLQTLATLGGITWSGMGFSVNANNHLEPVDLPDTFDEIDHFNITHKVRDHVHFPIPRPSLYKDVVVVGGGISGLTALYRLRDVDALLVEKETAVGGNSRRCADMGIHCPLGAIVSQGAIAPFTDFFQELAIPFERINGNALAYHVEGRLVVDPLGQGWEQLPFSHSERDGFRQCGHDLSFLLHPRDGIFFPRSDNKPEIGQLDRITLRQYLDSKTYSASVKQFLDLMLSSRVGERGEMVSAWIALYVLSTLMAPTFTLPGGHGVISEILRNRCLQAHSDSILTGFTVVQVQHQADGKVWITGVLQDGSLQTIAARCAIMAVPKVFAKHAVQGLLQERSHIYKHFRYNAYLVAQVHLSQRLATAFEVVSSSHFSRFIVAADWLQNNRPPQGGSHLTIYVPFPGVQGRVALYGGQAKNIAARIIADLYDIIPESRSAVERIWLQRWGHPMLSCVPSMDEIVDAAKQPYGNIAFGHSDSFGICGLYSAVWAGMDASNDARILLEDPASAPTV